MVATCSLVGRLGCAPARRRQSGVLALRHGGDTSIGWRPVGVRRLDRGTTKLVVADEPIVPAWGWRTWGVLGSLQTGKRARKQSNAGESLTCPI